MPQTHAVLRHMRLNFLSVWQCSRWPNKTREKSCTSTFPNCVRPENLVRLRERSLPGNRSLALKEFAPPVLLLVETT